MKSLLLAALLIASAVIPHPVAAITKTITTQGAHVVTFQAGDAYPVLRRVKATCPGTEVGGAFVVWPATAPNPILNEPIAFQTVPPGFVFTKSYAPGGFVGVKGLLMWVIVQACAYDTMILEVEYDFIR